MRLVDLALCGVALCSLVLPSFAQGVANVQIYGTPCGTTPPRIGALVPPRIGNPFPVAYTGPNSLMVAADGSWQSLDWPVLVVGATRVDLPLPPLFWIGTGCTQYPSLDVIIATMFRADGTGFVTPVVIQIPNQANLVGRTAIGQWLVLSDAVGQQMRLSASDGMIVTIAP